MDNNIPSIYTYHILLLQILFIFRELLFGRSEIFKEWVETLPHFGNDIPYKFNNNVF